jgi:hypothetical protein
MMSPERQFWRSKKAKLGPEEEGRSDSMQRMISFFLKIAAI